ncbi:PITH domain-containing protein, partial [Mycena floridula]
SLLEFLDSQQANCLNEASDHGLKAIIASRAMNTSDSFLLSDADEQLLLNIAFNQNVRVRSIVIRSAVANQAPKRVKLVINRPSVGFDELENAEEPEVSQILELSKEDVLEGKPIALRFVRFQAVNSIHIFVVSNHGDEDETRIDAIDFFGVPAGGTKDLSGLKNQEHQH